MSKHWPDPLHDRGDDFWEFDNMVNEYNYEQRRRELPHQQKNKGIMDSFIVKHTAIALIILAGLAVLSILFPIAWIAFFVYLFVVVK